MYFYLLFAFVISNVVCLQSLLFDMEWLKIGDVPPDVLNEAFMDPLDMLKLYGHPGEKHTITTKDGFLLSIYRIPNTTDDSIPILLMHGMGCTATQYFYSQFGSLAFLLADNGFDVWMGNFRGGPYTSHIKYEKCDKKYWDFSWEEMVVYDLPETIDFVLKVTNKSRIVLAAQSMGTTVSFAFLSSQPSYNNKIAGYLAITPVAFLNYIPSLVNKYLNLFSGFIQRFSPEAMLGVEGIALNSSMQLCSRHDKSLCALTSSVVGGFGPNLLNSTRMPIYIAHCRYGTSKKTVLHLAQIMEYNGMHKYDYGAAKNQILYNSLKPPGYNLSSIRVPIVVFHGANDALSDPLDVELLCRSLKSLIGKELIPAPLFTHSDCMNAANGKELMYDNFIKYAREMWLRQ